MDLLKKLSLSIFILFVLFTSACTTTKRQWQAVSVPTVNPSQVYGTYSAGCLDGGVALSPSTNQYLAMRSSRKRTYGHPQLIHFLIDYSDEVYRAGLGSLAIGDLSQARGGPMLQGHASHQTGLDVDIWFTRFSDEERKKMTPEKAELMSAISMVNTKEFSLNLSNWTKENSRVLKMAASYDDVERIFVNFVIKKQLCKDHKGEKWLNKIRPWWGHVYHYHVRLACPEGDVFCKKQKPTKNNDGCDDTLEWWFSDEAMLKLSDEESMSKDKKEIILPTQCEVVYSGGTSFAK